MLIKRVYEIDPLACPNCGGTMKVVAFLEPPQADVIEKILRHCGLWHATRAPPAGEDLVHGPDGHSQAANDAPRELTFVADHAIWGDGLSPLRRPARGLCPRPLRRLWARDVRRLLLQAALHVSLLPPEADDPAKQIRPEIAGFAAFALAFAGMIIGSLAGRTIGPFGANAIEETTQ